MLRMPDINQAMALWKDYKHRKASAPKGAHGDYWLVPMVGHGLQIAGHGTAMHGVADTQHRDAGSPHHGDSVLQDLAITRTQHDHHP